MATLTEIFVAAPLFIIVPLTALIGVAIGYAFTEEK